VVMEHLPEGEEVLNLLLSGGLADVLNVNSGGRHDVICVVVECFSFSVGLILVGLS